MGSRFPGQSFRRERRSKRDEPWECECFYHCPECDDRCLGGHSMFPDKHWCAENHKWTTPVLP